MKRSVPRSILRIIPILFVMLFWIGCLTEASGSYTQIDQETAKEMMSRDDGHVIVDVRRQDEYDSGHIPGAILIPNESIGDHSPEALPDYDQIILIYCRSGNRSKQAAKKLADMGYTNIYEFGGINTWSGDIVDDAPDVTLTSVRQIADFYLYRDGEIFYDSYHISHWEDGYHVSVNDEDDQHIDTASVDALMQVIDEYDLSQWDGFDETNENVLDGKGFWLEIRLTDGTSIEARGENAFPKNYFPAIGKIQEILENAEITP